MVVNGATVPLSPAEDNQVEVIISLVDKITSVPTHKQDPQEGGVG